jgi:hypothetical protein
MERGRWIFPNRRASFHPNNRWTDRRDAKNLSIVSSKGEEILVSIRVVRSIDAESESMFIIRQYPKIPGLFFPEVMTNILLQSSVLGSQTFLL